MAAWVLNMFCNFYFVNNHKIVINLTTANASEKISTDLESLEFLDACLTLFKKQANFT